MPPPVIDFVAPRLGLPFAALGAFVPTGPGNLGRGGFGEVYQVRAAKCWVEKTGLRDVYGPLDNEVCVMPRSCLSGS